MFSVSHNRVSLRLLLGRMSRLKALPGLSFCNLLLCDELVHLPTHLDATFASNICDAASIFGSESPQDTVKQIVLCHLVSCRCRLSSVERGNGFNFFSSHRASHVAHLLLTVIASLSRFEELKLLH